MVGHVVLDDGDDGDGDGDEVCAGNSFVVSLGLTQSPGHHSTGTYSKLVPFHYEINQIKKK